MLPAPARPPHRTGTGTSTTGQPDDPHPVGTAHGCPHGRRHRVPAVRGHRRRAAPQPDPGRQHHAIVPDLKQRRLNQRRYSADHFARSVCQGGSRARACRGNSSGQLGSRRSPIRQSNSMEVSQPVAACFPPPANSGCLCLCRKTPGTSAFCFRGRVCAGGRRTGRVPAVVIRCASVRPGSQLSGGPWPRLCVRRRAEAG